MHTGLCVYINLCFSGSTLPCMHCSLSLTQYAVWSCLQPHLSPSRDRRGYDSPKRSTFLADLHTWYLGGRGPLAGTLSCRWLPADRPCSPMPRPPQYRSGTCTRHSVPRPPGNVAWHVPRWRTRLAEWTIRPKASLISFCMVAVELLLFVFTAAASSQEWQYRWEFSKSTAALNGAMEHLATVAACCYFCVSSSRQRLAPIQLFCLRLLPHLPGWWGVATSELLHKC